MPNVVSLFAGGGGLDLGFSAAGFDVVYANDIDHHSCQTLRLNQNRREYYGHHLVQERSITELNTNDILQQVNLLQQDIDFVIGGPPCQAFSVFGKRKGQEDPRSNLVFEYARIIEELQPTGFLFENVSGLRTIHDGDFYKGLLDTLSFNGQYTVSAYEYNVADYGIPQFRTRVIIIGSLNGISVPRMESTHTAPNTLFNAHRPYTTVNQSLRGMPTPGRQSGLFNHIGREHSQRIVERYTALTYGERDSMTRINRLHPARPSYTIIVGSDKGGGKGHVHPYEPREVTPRESARLQTFPDWWEFYGNGRHVIRQVGNAVPPLFGALLANHVNRQLFDEPNNLTYGELVNRLGLTYLENAN